MSPRFLLVLGLGAGYVLGARAGRGRYEQIKAKATELWENPRVKRARSDVESFAREQGPIIRDRAEAAAKAAPGVIADGARAAAGAARDVADKTADVAKDVADRVNTTARDVADRVGTTAKDVAGKIGDAATDARGQVSKAAADLRDRGEAVVDRAVYSAGSARDDALETIDDEDPRA